MGGGFSMFAHTSVRVLLSILAFLSISSLWRRGPSKSNIKEPIMKVEAVERPDPVRLLS